MHIALVLIALGVGGAGGGQFSSFLAQQQLLRLPQVRDREQIFLPCPIYMYATSTEMDTWDSIVEQ